ncbi:MAG: CYTH domain-containing protein [Acidobacteriota bacterium]
MALEQEIKLPVESLALVREALVRAGGRLVTPEELEENWVLDRADAAVVRSGQLLRVRRWGARAWITHKGPATVAHGVKSRRELEVEVSDSGAALELFAALG